MVDLSVDASGLVFPAERPAKCGAKGVLAERLRFIWLLQLREFMLPEYDLG